MMKPGLMPDCSTELEPGELVKDGYFTLFESVGALEVCVPYGNRTETEHQADDLVQTDNGP